ncbi:ADP-ribosylglycohydrolase family protein [Granulosicoccus antarcticus]|uniref:ADP-ribosylglycohydrolase n=1 Tax=Granulosicoccus antarcticus IMCC3135 TaxID=1192854 RepID=A0A2Z2NPX3_9GAMM|nr:ADP-ribosylglycohydrolase family protein [Granulosicoccus antarcticus]ASJ73343.1 hypothetical protein IMCC3135_16305 [Granulosicoccus antarcticus IMCC3135]
MNRNDALAGALVADAAAMGLHWLYDQEQISTVAASGDLLFRQPDSAVYQGKKGYFAHAARRAGQLSHYGESARIVGQLASEDAYQADTHRQRFLEAFGPCGHYVGYADRPTKTLVARMINEGAEISEPSGMDDNQMPAVCVVAGIFSAAQSADTVRTAAQVISTNEEVVASAAAVYQCLEQVLQGKSLADALSASAEAMTDTVGALMRDALAIEGYQPLETASRFGLACYVEHSMPVVWHLLKHATDFESAVRDNIRCGGDSCGRSMALGAIAGLVFGVPDSLVARMADARVPITERFV